MDTQDLRLRDMTIYLQPIVHGPTGRILGAEALARWQQPDGSVRGPDSFLEMLERDGSVALLDMQNLRRICELLQELSRAGREDFFLCCNFSRTTLVQPDFVQQFSRVLREFGFPLKNLVLEVTEYAQVSQQERLWAHVRQVQQMGVRVFMDDFGGGRSDLQDLSRFRFDGVKLDRSLVVQMPENGEDTLFVGMVDIMRRLRMLVVAEGVETREQLRRMLDAGVDAIQGYYFYRPLPVKEMRKLL